MIALTDTDWSDKTILVAEDVATNYILIDAILKRTGAKLVWARNGEDAVNAIKNQDDINLILMDIQMPVLDGLEATRAIRKINPKVPVIAQTAYVIDYERDKLLASGCNGIITKPLHPEILIREIRKYLEGYTPAI